MGRASNTNRPSIWSAHVSIVVDNYLTRVAPLYTGYMSPTVAEMFEKAKSLEHDEMADLVYQLLRVLDDKDPDLDQAEVDQAWRAEFRRRINDVESERVELVDGRETLAMAREMLAARRR